MEWRQLLLNIRAALFFITVLLFFEFFPLSLQAQVTDKPLVEPAPLTPSTSSTSKKVLHEGIGGKASAVTRVPVPYQFTVTVLSPWHYRNNTQYDYGTYYAICPAGTSQISGPDAHTLAELHKCTCDASYCHPPYSTQVVSGGYRFVRTQAVCLVKIPMYVPTSSLSSSLTDIPVKKGYPDDAHPFVYPFDDSPFGPTVQKGNYYGSVYNPIPNVNNAELLRMDFNSSYIISTGWGYVAPRLPCPW